LTAFFGYKGHALFVPITGRLHPSTSFLLVSWVGLPFAPNQFFTALRLTVSIAAFTAWLVRADVRAATVNTISVITFKGLRSTTDLYFPKTDSITSELPNHVSPGLASAACPSSSLSDLG
jgi:hypothetical protein